MFRSTYAAFRMIRMCYTSTFSLFNKTYCYSVVQEIIQNTSIAALKKSFYKNLFLTHSGFVAAGCCFSKGTSHSESPLITNRNRKYSEHLLSMNESVSDEVVNNVDSITLKRSFSNEGNKNNTEADGCTSKRFKTTVLDSDEASTPVPEILQNIDEPDIKCDEFENNDVLPEKRKKVKEKKMQAKPRPNYFVAVKISNTKIHDALKEVQDHILEQDQYMKPIMIGLSTLHVTLMVLYIGDEDTHQRALNALEQVKNEYDDKICKEPLELEIKGLGNFRNRVLFAKITNDKAHNRLCDLADNVNQYFEAACVPSTDSRKEFNPHLTIAKITFDRKCRNIKKIKPSLYSSYDDRYFGHQTVKSIQLLSMTKPKDITGYYSGDEFFFSAFTPVSVQEHRKCIEEKKEEVKKAIQDLTKNIT